MSTEDSFELKNGNAAAEEVKKVTTSDSRGFVSEIASKYHQSKTDALMELNCGASRASNASVVSVDLGVGMLNLAWLVPSWTSLRM